MKQCILKPLTALYLSLMASVVWAQDSAWQPVLSSVYEGVDAKYAVLKTDADESIAIKFKNNTTSTCLIVLQIEKKAGPGEQKIFTVKPFANLFENIGDANTVFVSTILFTAGSKAESDLIVMAKQREKIVKNNSLLKTQKISASDVQSIALPGAEEEVVAKVTEVDYLGVKGIYKRLDSESGKPAIGYTFKNTRTDLEAIVTVKANGAVLHTWIILPGKSFAGSAIVSAINIEVDFKDISEGFFSEALAKIRSTAKDLLIDIVTTDPNDKTKVQSQKRKATVMGPRG